MIRTHGDLHLGQTMLSDRGWVILDFEGEPARPLPERRLKRSPLRDVAGMLRSFSYAAAGARILRADRAAGGLGGAGAGDVPRGLPRARGPVAAAARPAGVRPAARVFELEKAVYELRYELNNRPDWVGIPVAGIVRLLDSDAPSRSPAAAPRELDARADAELRVDAREVVLDRLLARGRGRRRPACSSGPRRRGRRSGARARRARRRRPARAARRPSAERRLPEPAQLAARGLDEQAGARRAPASAATRCSIATAASRSPAAAERAAGARVARRSRRGIGPCARASSAAPVAIRAASRAVAAREQELGARGRWRARRCPAGG